jgi:hypothetical protein
MIRKGETLFLQATCEPDEQPHEGVGLKPCREVPAWNATPLKILEPIGPRPVGASSARTAAPRLRLAR